VRIGQILPIGRRLPVAPGAASKSRAGRGQVTARFENEVMFEKEVQLVRHIMKSPDFELPGAVRMFGRILYGVHAAVMYLSTVENGPGPPS
jgi:hypothetical protein